MASTDPCEQFIFGYSPEAVLAEGKFVKHLPENEGFSLDVESDTFDMGVIAHVGLTVKGKDFGLQGEVTTFDPAGKIEIRGESHVGKALVWINLIEDEERGGTVVHSGVKVRHSLITKAFEPVVVRHLDKHLPLYAADYTENVINALGAPKRRRVLAKAA